MRGESTLEKEPAMEYRQLGSSGLRVPVLSFGTATFGGDASFTVSSPLG
jgi:aryl-alcohol dehydrogenase-like predicted oxidoreductase